MKIGVDARFLIEQKTGVETYFHELLGRMIAMGGPEEFVLFRCGRRDPQLPAGRWRRAGEADGSVANGALHTLSLLRRERPDLFYSPVTAFPLAGISRLIITVHDLAWHTFPSGYPWEQRVRYDLWLRMATRRADRIVTVSGTTRDDLLALRPAAAPKVSVIPPGVDEAFFRETSPESQRRVREHYGLSGSYVMTVATLHPRKNLPRLLQGFDRYRAGTPQRTQLLVAGRGGEDSPRLLAHLRRSPHGDDVVLPGYVPREDLPALYSGAELFVLPSQREGFGIPPLEAMACGVPVLVSDIPIFREVCGDAAVRVDPDDPEAIARGIRAASRGAPGCDERVRQGRERARLFRWERSARALRDLILSTVGGRRAA